MISDDLSATWETVMRDHPEIRDDPRFLRLSSHPDVRQKEAPILFAQHMRERVGFSLFLFPFFLVLNEIFPPH